MNDDEYLKLLISAQNENVKKVCLKNWDTFCLECDSEKLENIKKINENDTTIQVLAGNGKTFFVYGCTIWLVSRGLVSLSEILFLSFTNTAKNETFNRLIDKIGMFASSLISSYTVHSFALGLVNLKNKNKNTRLYAPFSSKEIKDILQEFKEIKDISEIVALIYGSEVLKENLPKKELEILRKYDQLKRYKHTQMTVDCKEYEHYDFISYDEIIIKAIILLKDGGFGDLTKFKFIFFDEG